MGGIVHLLYRPNCYLCGISGVITSLAGLHIADILVNVDQIISIRPSDVINQTEDNQSNGSHNTTPRSSKESYSSRVTMGRLNFNSLLPYVRGSNIRNLENIPSLSVEQKHKVDSTVLRWSFFLKFLVLLPLAGKMWYELAYAVESISNNLSSNAENYPVLLWQFFEYPSVQAILVDYQNIHRQIHYAKELDDFGSSDHCHISVPIHVSGLLCGFLVGILLIKNKSATNNLAGKRLKTYLILLKLITFLITFIIVSSLILRFGFHLLAADTYK